MKALVGEIAEYVALATELTAVVVITVGSVLAVVAIARAVLTRTVAQRQRAIWLDYARWLVAGLTFQLAADVVHTTVAPTWDDIGKAAAIAAIRTFLTLFLDRDMENVEKRGEQSMAEAS